MTVPETTSAPLIITLFGPMQILVDGQPLPRLRSRKGLWLLTLLALRHGKPVEREWLAGTLWPDMEQSQAFANLRPILSELRNGLGSQHERLKSPERQTLLLNLEGADVDILAFNAAMKRGKLPDLEQAVSLYRGHLLEGCTEEWVFQERSVREHQCLQALQKLATAALTAGDYGKAIGYYQRASVLDPWGDSVRRGWMEALAKSGDRNAALQVYREFVEVLRDDPNAIPDEQTTALYVRLRAEARTQNRVHAVVAAEPVVVSKISGYLPHPMTELIGREDERLEVSARLRRSRLLTLTGLGGIGKTRLALDVAREVAREYTDGVWLVALDALTEGKQVMPQIASALEVKEESGLSLLESVTRHLKSKRSLLVLDNCEHLLQASAQVAGHLLRECGELRILATSREALEITGETVWAVPALATPDPAHLPEGHATLLRVLMSYESVQLFVERAQAVQKKFVLTASNARYVAEVCFRLEGIPLALELAAARIKSMTAEQIAERLDNELSLLTGGSHIAQSRQQTLRAMLDWSYALLNATEQMLLCRLSVFAGGWTLEAAEAVCSEGEGATDTGTIQTQEVLDLLNSLVDKSLVAFEDREQSGGGRYRLLEIVRQYAAEKLQTVGETDLLRDRHRDWCVVLAEEAEPQLKGSNQEVWLQRLETEYDNLRVALGWREADAQGAEARLRLTSALWWFWYVYSNFHDGRRYLKQALENPHAQARTAARAKVLNGSGALAYDQGDYAEARAFFAESLSIRRELGDQRGIALSLNNLGNVDHDQGHYTSAQALYEESLRLLQELGDKSGMALALGNLGNVARPQGNINAARALYEESLNLYRELGERRNIPLALLRVGVVVSLQGDYASARSLYEESLSLRREFRDRRGVAWTLVSLGELAASQGEFTESRILFEESLDILMEFGDRRGIAISRGNLGHVAYYKEEYTSARETLEESLVIFKEIEDQRSIAHTLTRLADVIRASGDDDAAQLLYREALGILRTLEDNYGAARSMEGLAAVKLAQAEPQIAVSLLGAIHTLRERLGTPRHPCEQKGYQKLIEQARAALGRETFVAIWTEGCALNWEQAIEFALTAEIFGQFDVTAK